MRQHGQRGNHAQTDIGHEGRSNQNAVAKAVHAVAREHSPATFAMVVPMVVVMIVLMFMLVRLMHITMRMLMAVMP